jgi:hypothetical protein
MKNHILRRFIDIIEAIQYDMSKRAKAVLEEDPAALNRAFRDYGLFPWDAEAWHTPLAYAVTRAREEIVRLLIGRGAVETLRSPEGDTLSEIAQKAGHPEIALIFRRCSGKGRSPKLDKLPIYSLRIRFVCGVRFSELIG